MISGIILIGFSFIAIAFCVWFLCKIAEQEISFKNIYKHVNTMHQSLFALLIIVRYR